MVGEIAETQAVAEFSPQNEKFKPDAFTNCIDNDGGKEYLELDPYTLDGLKEAARINKIDEDGIQWNSDLHLLYEQVLLRVQNKGRLGNWTTSVE